MQNLMDILSFKIDLKNSQTLNEIQGKVDEMYTKIMDLDGQAQSNVLRLELYQDDLKGYLQGISNKIEEGNSKYRGLEYH
mmetsp:Transcript_30868/g.27301  ORF Transcript_30868/g.27301 Transcript_30868/m.27301 type:complete len:80 (-) Transcript_30868:118-357(-)